MNEINLYKIEKEHDEPLKFKWKLKKHIYVYSEHYCVLLWQLMN